MNSLVHLVQLDCIWEDKAANFDRVRQLLFETRRIARNVFDGVQH